MGKSARAAAQTLTCAALLFACGSDDDGPTDSAKNFSGEEQMVAQVVERFEAAAKDGDIERICKEIYAPKLISELKRIGRRCDEASVGARDIVDRYGGRESFDMNVVRVRVSGVEATADVRCSGGDRDREETLTFLKEGDSWGLGIVEEGSSSC